MMSIPAFEENELFSQEPGFFIRRQESLQKRKNAGAVFRAAFRQL